jgi:glycosyltransferase involved in cell wall biosynthesis
MLILAIGDSVRSQTGYGRVSQNVFKHFLRRGHQIMHIGWQHSEPAEFIEFKDKTGYIGKVAMFPPHTTDEFYTMSTIMHLRQKPQMLYNSNDIFTNAGLVNARREGKLIQDPFFLVNYGVIDAIGAAKVYKDIIDGIDLLVVPSKFGYNELRKVTDKGLYIPHGVDLDIYHPMQNKELLKQNLGIQNKFTFGVVHRNINRKLIPFVIEAFSNLKHKHGLKNIALYLVMDPTEKIGYDVFALCKIYNLVVTWNPKMPGDVYLHPQHLNYTISLSENQLAEAYNSFDVLVSASMSEGFGLPTLEGAACGTPSIMCDHSANTELVDDHGWLYPAGKNIDGSLVSFPGGMSAGGQWMVYGYPVPDKVALEAAMLDAYNNTTKVSHYSKKCIEFAKNYSWDIVLPMWDEVLRRCEQFWDQHKIAISSKALDKTLSEIGVLANGAN